MGPLTPDQMELFQKNPRFIGVKFPEMIKPETLEKKYLGKLSKKALSFMKACLKMDPSERITASEALQHSYFDGLRERDVTPTPTAQHADYRIESAKSTLNSTNKLASGQINNNAAGSSIKLNVNGSINSSQVSQPGTQKTGSQTTSNHEKKMQGNAQNIGHLNENKNSLLVKSKVGVGNLNSGRGVHVEKPAERSASLNKTSVRVDKLQQAYDNKTKLKENLHSTQSNFHNRKTTGMNIDENDHIEGKFHVPDVWMKTKYGSTNQYNYEIREQNESELDENSPQKVEAFRKSQDQNITVLFISMKVKI